MSEIPTADWTWINAAADRFERDWKQGPRPRIEDFLAEVDEARRPLLLEELLRVERELRRRDGEEPDPEEYSRRFSGHAALIDAVFGPEPARSAADRPATRTPTTTAPITTGGIPTANGEPAPGTHVRYFGDYEIRRRSAAAAWASSTRPGRSASTARRAQDDPVGRPGLRRRAPPLPERGRGRRPARPPAHRADLRGRRARRPALLLA